MIDPDGGLKLKKDQPEPTRVLGPRAQNLGKEKLKYNLLCEGGRNRKSAKIADYRQRASQGQGSGTVSGQVVPPPSSAADASLAPDGPPPVAKCSPVVQQELAQDRGQDLRTAFGQVGPPLPLPAAPPPSPLPAALDASCAPPLAIPPATPAQALPFKAKPRDPPRLPPAPPPPAPSAKGTWGQNGQNLVEIDSEDDEEARKREMAPIEILFGAE